MEVTSILQNTGFLSGLLRVISTVAGKHFSNDVIILRGNSTYCGSITNLGFNPLHIIYLDKLANLPKRFNISGKSNVYVYTSLGLNFK